MTSKSDNTEKRELLSSFYSDAIESIEGADSETLILKEISEYNERYTILKKVAQGAVKTIYLVEDKVMGRNLAMAVRQDYKDLEDSEGFLREARITSALQRPNIIPIYDMGVNDENHAFFTMKYIEGESLREILERLKQGDFQSQQKYPESELIEIFQRVCEAVAFAHSHGVLHLDLKPENIQVSDYGEVLLCDWGLAEIMDSKCDDPHLERYSFDNVERKNITFENKVSGTPGFMAPEQIKRGGNKDSRTDIFALGALLFEMIYLEPAISGDDKIRQTEDDPTASFEEKVLENLTAISYKCLQSDPDSRYKNVDAVLDDLRAYRHGFATSAEEAPFGRHLKLFYNRHILAFNLVATFIILTIAGIVISFYSIKQSEREAVRAKVLLEEEKTERQRLGLLAVPNFMKKAKRAYLYGKLDEALENAIAVVTLVPEHDDAWNLIGKAYFLKGDYKKASDSFRSLQFPLNKMVKELADDFIENKLSETDKCDRLKELLKYCGQINAVDDKMVFIFHFAQSRDKAVRAMATNHIGGVPLSHCRRLLQLSTDLDKMEALKLLKKVLLVMEKNPDWIKRHIPALTGMTLSPTEEMRGRFEALVPANLALGKKVETNGGDERSASLAVDGVISQDSGFWAGNPYPAHLTIDLGGEFSVSSFKTFFYYGNKRYYQYIIQVSNDRTFFKTVVDRSENEESSTTEPFIDNIEPVKARYIRLKVTKNSLNEAVHVREFEVY